MFEVVCTALSAFADSKGVNAGTGVCYEERVFWYVTKA